MKAPYNICISFEYGVQDRPHINYTKVLLEKLLEIEYSFDGEEKEFNFLVDNDVTLARLFCLLADANDSFSVRTWESHPNSICIEIH